MMSMNFDRRSITVASLAVLLFTTASPAAEVLVYDNGPPFTGFNANGVFSDFDSPQQSADDFVFLPGDATFDRVEWWGVYSGSNTVTEPDDFTIRIFTDNSGQPAAAFLQQVLAGAVPRTPVGPSGSTPNFELYRYDYVLGAPITLTAGTTYWLSVVNNTPTDLDDNWGWWGKDFSTTVGALSRARSHDGEAWPIESRDMAFNLSRTIVPEPSSLVLAAFGIIGVAARAWRKRNRETRSSAVKAAPSGPALLTALSWKRA